ncbi:MAG: malonate--CoA ligase [Minwuia sp.]|uniref:malonate--CoA ligase n=1 Tax=Minwuia sp. TaxID=2493630 RepID=UPI003A83737C
MSNHLYDLLIGARSDEDKTFIDVPGGRTISFRQLHAEAGQVASALAAMGVEPGDRVAVQAEKSAEAVALYLGVVRAGAIFLPLNTAYTPSEIDYFVGNARPRVFVGDPSKAEALRPIAEKHGARLETLAGDGSGTLWQAVGTASPDFAAVPRGEDDLAAILYTSGTTGRSKGAMLSHRNLSSNAEVLKDYWRFTADDVLLHALPIYHSHGLFVAINVSLLAGATMIFFAKFEAEAMVREMPRATTMMGVPTFYTRLLSTPSFTREVAGPMRLFISGSAPLLAETHKQFSDLTGHAILERYGMTETNMNSSNPYDGDRRGGTVGFPLPGVELRVASPDTGEVLGAGEIGVIEVKGPNVFSGYWQMPEKTAEEFRADGFFITGDLGKIDEDGYVTIVGRGKDLVISGGFNVYPKEIEEKIDDLPGVLESAVIGVPHADFGEGVTAVVVRDGSRDLTEDDIAGPIRESLAAFKRPKKIIFVDELPRNTMGKVQKNVLRDTYRDIYGA